MPFFNWFGKKTTPAASPSRGVPTPGAELVRQGAADSPSARTERYERREQLYAVVRETMTRAGLISSSYKFKVLSLDSRGIEYLVMVDVGQAQMADPHTLHVMEQSMALAAKTRYQMVVNAVYWRANAHLLSQRGNGSSGASGASEANASATARALQSAQPQPVPAHTPVGAPTSATAATAAYEPVQEDELQQFKKALATMPAQGPLSAPGQIVQTGPRKPLPSRDFQETVMDERAMSPLSSTQWGDV